MNPDFSQSRVPRCVIVSIFALFCALAMGLTPTTALADTDVSTMYRLYNPYTGEHFYTSSYLEIGNCVVNGWRCEGGAWLAPDTSNTPVYRLYNPFTGDHHYTMSKEEYDYLATVGWSQEGIGWYSDDSNTTAVYRQYNPNATTGSHNFTTSDVEKKDLVGRGWKDEGVGWYAAGAFSSITTYDEDAKTAAQAGLDVTEDTVVVYRLYDTYNGANYYTTDLEQIGYRVVGNYIFKGAAWLSPRTSENPVHCVVNQKTWDALYLTEGSEFRALTDGDWNDEGVAFYACESQTDAPVYRLYDPDGDGYDDEKFSRIFTASASEHKNLVKAGFNDEGVPFYVVAAPDDDDGTSSWHYAIADSSAGKIYLYNSGDSLVKTVDCQFTGGQKWIGEHTVCRKARGYWADEYCTNVNDWWVCFIDATTNYNSGGVLRPLGNGKYEDGAGFHYGFSGSGCVVIGNMEDAKYVYDFLDIGSKVICK